LIAILAFALVLSITQLQAKLLITSQIRSRTEYAIPTKSTYYILMLLLHLYLTQNLALLSALIRFIW